MSARLRLGEALIRDGFLTSHLLEEALDRQQLLGGLLGSNLLDLAAVEEDVLLRALGRQASAPVVHREELTTISPRVLDHLPMGIAERHRIVPFRIDGNTLLIASIRPIDIPLEDLLGEATALMIRTHLTLEVRLWQALERYYGVPAPHRIKQLLRQLTQQTSSSNQGPIVLPPDLTRLTQPLTTLVVPAPSPFDLLQVEPSDESLWGGLHVEDVDSKLNSHKINDELEQLIRLSDEHEPILPESQTILPESHSEDTQPIRAAHAAAHADTFSAPSPREHILALPLKDTHYAEALLELKNTERRERVAEVVLDVTAPFFKRRLLLASRQNKVIGWRGAGEGLTPLRIHTLSFEPAASPMFLSLDMGSSFWLGGLVDNQIHVRMIEIFGGKSPPDCVLLPIRIRDRAVAYFYADNGTESIAGAPIAELQPLMDAAASGLLSFIRAKRRSRVLLGK